MKGYRNLSNVVNPETGETDTGHFIVLRKLLVSLPSGDAQFAFDYYDSEAAFDGNKDTVRWLQEKFANFTVTLTEQQVNAVMADPYNAIKAGFEAKLGVTLETVAS